MSAATRKAQQSRAGSKANSGSSLKTVLAAGERAETAKKLREASKAETDKSLQEGTEKALGINAGLQAVAAETKKGRKGKKSQPAEGVEREGGANGAPDGTGPFAKDHPGPTIQPDEKAPESTETAPASPESTEGAPAAQTTPTTAPEAGTEPSDKASKLQKLEADLTKALADADGFLEQYEEAVARAIRLEIIIEALKVR